MSRIGRTVAIATQLTVPGFSQARAQAAEARIGPGQPQALPRSHHSWFGRVHISSP